MFTGPEFIEFVEGKLEEHGVEKVVPDDDLLAATWKRAKVCRETQRVDRGVRRSQTRRTTRRPEISGRK